MWNKDSVTVVVPSKNNANTIRYVIEDLYLTGYVDDLIAIDIHSEDNTLNEISYTKARLLSADSLKEAISLGIERAKGQLIVFIQPDGSYPAQEIEKLLAYSSGYDVVFGSRTQDIGFRKDMKHFSYARIFLDLGEKLSKRFNCPLITDIDSGAFLVRRSHYLNKRFFLEYGENYCFLEFIIRTIKNNSRFIQVPLEWRGDLEQKNNLSSLVSRMRFYADAMRIIKDKQPLAVIKDKKKQEKKEDKEKTEIQKRKFSPDNVVHKETRKDEKKKKKKSTTPAKKGSANNKSSKNKNNLKTKQTAKEVLKRAANTTNRYDPGEFS